MEICEGSVENGQHRFNNNFSVNPIYRDHGEREPSQMAPQVRACCLPMDHAVNMIPPEGLFSTLTQTTNDKNEFLGQPRKFGKNSLLYCPNVTVHFY